MVGTHWWTSLNRHAQHLGSPTDAIDPLDHGGLPGMVHKTTLDGETNRAATVLSRRFPGVSDCSRSTDSSCRSGRRGPPHHDLDWYQLGHHCGGVRSTVGPFCQPYKLIYFADIECIYGTDIGHHGGHRYHGRSHTTSANHGRTSEYMGGTFSFCLAPGNFSLLCLAWTYCVVPEIVLTCIEIIQKDSLPQLRILFTHGSHVRIFHSRTHCIQRLLRAQM